MSVSLEEFDRVNFENSCNRLDKPSGYLMKRARREPNGLEDLRNLYTSGTVYVGNLSFHTSEEQIYELFVKCGTIKQIIMGLDRFKHTPCGFCFVIYNNPEDAVNAVKYLSKTKLDERVIKIDLDSGFTNGRQFGRGASGGQVRDEIRYDMADSGYRYGGYQATEFDDNNGNNDDFNNETNYRFGARRVADVYVPENKEVAAEAEVEAPVKADAEGDEEMKDTTEN